MLHWKVRTSYAADHNEVMAIESLAIENIGISMAHWHGAGE